jgi:hypothetical protein
VDDGSTEDIRELVNSYGGRVRYIWRENGGPAAARNTGIANSNGQYVVFLDDDDYLLPQKLALLVAALNERPEIGIVVGGYLLVNAEGKPLRAVQPWLAYPELDFQVWLLSHPAALPAIMFRRCWLEQVGGFDERLRRNEDCDLLIRLTYQGCRAVWIKELVCAVRRHAGNQSKDAYQQSIAHDIVLDKFFSQHEIPTDVTVNKDEVYARSWLYYAGLEYAVGQVAHAYSHLSEATALMPALLDCDGEAIVNVLAGVAIDLTDEEVQRYVHNVLANLPESLRSVQKLQRRLLGRIWMAKTFAAHSVRDQMRVRQAILSAIRWDPRCLLNRGILSIGCEAFMGQRLAQLLRWFARGGRAKRYGGAGLSH